MDIHQIRQKHHTFTYQEFDIKSNKNQLEVSFKFQLTPNIEFTPKVVLPLTKLVNPAKIENLVFHLGLIEMLSYWKSTCSPNIVIKAGQLTPQQISWWHDLFIHGLGEFYYQNKIDFKDHNFLEISAVDSAPSYPLIANTGASGDLILVGGGKDSITTVEILKKSNQRQGIMLLNPTRAALDTTLIAGINNPLIVSRTIDHRLLELNKIGYLNGHTPFSAYLSFLGTLMAVLHGYKHIIASNESSAGEGNINYLGMEINHQYSKSYRYEKMFRQYSQKSLATGVAYFSFLRPLSELQIAALFSKEKKYDHAFSSCNISRNKYWCGHCPKCAFVYLALNPFMDPSRIYAIFGKKNFFEDSQIQQYIKDLVGLGKHKPFECVGTKAESRLAVALIIFKYQRYNLKPPTYLIAIDQQLHLTQNTLEEKLLNLIKNDWSEEHFLPPKYSELLQSELKNWQI